MLPERDELQHAISRGFSAEDFLSSDLGQFIAEKAEHERTAALEALATCDAVEIWTIRKLQSQVAVADTAMQWLADAVILGRQAQERLRQLDQPD